MSIIWRITALWLTIQHENRLKRQQRCLREGHDIKKSVRVRYDFSDGDSGYEDREIRRECRRCCWRGNWYRRAGKKEKA